MGRMTESTVEHVSLSWMEGIGWRIAHGPEIAPDGPRPERSDYAQVVLEDRLRQALVSLNPELPEEAIEDAFRRITRAEGPTLEARNRAFHRILAGGALAGRSREDCRGRREV